MEIGLPQRFGEFFNGIAQHGPRHGLVVLPEKSLRCLLIALADLPQHPAHRLVNEIVPVGKEKGGDGQAIVKVVFLDEMQGGDDGDPPFPE